ncbi:hypothetical protein ON010_g11197 [Phytophthora cinnamomi]|nr:hypothetical protein ON010_g11197 [Phytophthora cinnamomi]
MMETPVQVFPEQNVDKVETSTRVRVLDKELNLTLLMQADELAPLFSGAAWAGTLLWDAAVHLARRFLTDYRQQLEDPSNSLRVIELGAGIGVPGMAARVAGAKHVVLTEQDELLRLMHVNLAANAEVLRLPGGEELADGGVSGAIPRRKGGRGAVLRLHLRAAVRDVVARAGADHGAAVRGEPQVRGNYGCGEAQPGRHRQVPGVRGQGDQARVQAGRANGGHQQ